MAACKPASEHSESYKHTQLKKIDTKHRLLMRLLIGGASLEESAKLIEISYQHAKLVHASPLFKSEMEKMEKDMYGDVVDRIKNRAKVEAPASFDTFVKLRDGATSETEMRKSAENILKIADVETDKVQVGVAIDAEQGFIDALGRKIAEMKGAAGKEKVENADD